MVTPALRVLPERANLDHQRTLARELLQAFRAGDPAALARVRLQLPDKPRIALADAQFVLAREYGFHDWSALRHELALRAAASQPPHEQLHHAMQQRDARAVRRLLGQHPEFLPLLNAPLFPFNAPAIVACADDAPMVDVLLAFGADPNARSQWWAGGFHALHSATPESAELLLAAGAVPDACAAAHLDRADLLQPMLTADPSRVAERGGDGQTPLHFARSRQVADLLLGAGADPDARDRDHRASPAEWMLARERDAGRYALAQHLVDRGASADIFLAAALGRTDRVRALLAIDPTLLDERTGQGRYGPQPPSSHHIYFWSIGAHRTPLETAAQFGHAETVTEMLRVATPVQQLRLHARTGDAAAAHALLQADPSLVASLPAAEHRALADAAWNGDQRAATLLLSLGFDPAVPGHDGGTALHCAAWQGAAGIVAALLATPAGAALLMVPDAHHNATPLGWCAHGSLHGPRTGAHAEVARHLLAAGAAIEELESSDAVERVIAAVRTDV